MKIVNVLAHNAWGDISSESIKRGIGGREGAMIRLSREWAELGHEVTNFVPTKTPERIYTDAGGFFEFAPVSMSKTMLATFPYYACVAWEDPEAFVNPRIVEKQPVRLIEMQCAHLSSDGMAAAQEFATGMIGLSQWHVDFLAHQGIDLPFHILPNGVDLTNYPRKTVTGLPDAPKFFYSSSPDRGLWHLLKSWHLIQQCWPNAELSVGYGVSKWLGYSIWSHRRSGQMAVEIAALMRQDGVTDLGLVGQDELARVQNSSNIMAYPCDTIQPTETGCITAIEAMAAGCPVVTTDCDCMAEEFGEVAEICPLPFDVADYTEAIERVLGDEERYIELAQKGRAFAETRQWKDISKRWIELFEEQRSLAL